MSNHKNLRFFNKEGDYLNFNYSEIYNRFEGDILFHENSTDTFKTYGIYTMENIPSFEFELPGELTTKKFQLFNEYGLNLYGSKYENEQITSISPVNNDPNFYSKWIYGDNFEIKFKIGTLLKFNSGLLEFTNTNQTYVVVGSKKDAIMIISQMDNATFESNYYSLYSDTNTYIGKKISGINAVGVYNYIDSGYENNLSNWSEPDFYDKYYVGKKLNLVNTELNDNVVSVENIDITDQIHFEFSTSVLSLPDNSDLIIEVITKTDIPKVYEGGLNITNDNIINISDTFNYPHLLKPGTEFKIVGSVNNQNFLTVSPIPTFIGNTQLTYYATQSQVLYNNRIYQCSQGYTQSFGSQSTAYVTPLNTTYWSNPTYVKVDQSTVIESLLLAQIYLVNDRYYFSTGWTSSSYVTMASAAQKYKDDLSIFNVDILYENNQIRADLIYPSDYTKVNFYHTEVGTTYSIGNELKISEKLVQVSEELNYELNNNLSENFKYNVVFTDIDEFGIKIEINKMIYQEEVAFIYTGLIIDMERTIDRTLRNWLDKYYLKLLSLGILSELQYIGNYTSIFYNSIALRTEFPNVPLDINKVEVGTTANYYIEHSSVLFTDMGPFLNIRINDDDYTQETIYLSLNIPDIPATLNAWYEEHNELLSSFDIIVTNINNLLKFDVKSLDRRLDYTITTGKVNIPGLQDYTIIEKILGNQGMLISSNEVILPDSSTFSFEEIGFATGMVFSINNTFNPFVNQDFNIQFLDPHVMNLSYQGSFWGLTDSLCNSSAFITLAFDSGFGQTGCTGSVGPTGSIGGPFATGDNGSLPMFNEDMFAISYNTNTYTVNSYDLNSFTGTTGLVDIKYVQLSSAIYSYGDNLVVVDAYLGHYITSIMIPGNTQSIEMEFNPINNYLYCLSKNQIHVVDPLINTLLTTISLTSSGTASDAFDMCINPKNGDVYVTYEDAPVYDIWYYNNITNTPSLQDQTTPSLSDTMTGKIVFNDFEEDVYITTDDDLVIRIDGDTRTFQTSYGITGLTHSIFYEPVNESIYVYGSASLWKIDNGLTQSITLISQPFNDIIFNNITNEMNISDSSTNFTRLDLNNDTYSQTGIANYGYLEMNQFDEDVYLSSLSLDTILVLDGSNGNLKYSTPLVAQSTKLVYNPERKSIWAIQPSINSIVEVVVHIGGVISSLPTTYDTIEDNQYGTLDPDYVPRPSIWLKTRDYIRRPRENFEGDVQVKYYWKWLSDNVPQFFMYDFSGDQLDITGSYSYTGPRPLTEIVLNKYPNTDVSKVGLPQYQQSIFDTIENTLSYIDDSIDISTDVEPLQLFLGFKSENEGSLRSILQLYKKEEINFDIISDLNTNITIETLDIHTEYQRGQLTINSSSTQSFTGHGLKPDQHIVIYLKDNNNNKNQYISDNNGIVVKIKEVYTKILVVDFFNLNIDNLESENTVISNYPSTGITTYLKLTIKVNDREIGRFTTYGQSEEEDIRFKVELGNVGKLIGPDEVFLFKDYDILEGGIDWVYLNMKRKEMMMMKHLIYPYIGAYKSIINAINYFGYNDLQLNEYYKNVDTSSENFSKLFKVEIPDIFDNTVEGWTENDFISNSMPNDNFDGTNLFNLTYFITDKDGNNILNYSVDEIIIKLQGLKYWLKRNIIPLTHKIMDISGKAYFNGGTYITHKLNDIRHFKINQEMTPITFKLNEAYLLPINSGSTVYNCVLDFYNISPGIGNDITPSVNILEKPLPFNGSDLTLPDYFNIKIRTYKTYKEWESFTTYNTGDKIIYFDNLYESIIDDNKINNPRKYENSSTWVSDTIYEETSIVEYGRDFYVYSALGSSQSTLTPNIDPSNWINVTEWRKIDYEPVQTLSEFRIGDDLLPFNFTIDSNIDPFIVAEVSCDNGYGSVYSDKKNYEIRGLKDLTNESKPIDPIGPFITIDPIY